MSTTGAILVQDAMYQAEVLGQDQPATAGDTNLVLRILNRMLQSWANESLTIPGSLIIDSFAMSPGVATYASTLLTVLGRPISLDSIYVRLNNLDYSVNLVDNQSYNDIPYKTVTAIPTVCYYDGGNPIANFNFYPVPYAAFTCFVSGFIAMPTVTLGSIINLPAGYEQAIIDNLAVKIWRFFKGSTMPIPQDLTMQAFQSLAIIKRNNFAPLEMDTGLIDSSADSNTLIYRGF